MNINPINSAQNNQTNKSFGHSHAKSENPYPLKDRAIIGGMVTLGTAAAIAILSKRAGNTLNPAKFKNIKNSYLATVKYEAPEVITIGAGSCLGGLAGGYIVDKDPVNRKAKRRETIMQIGNISVPILTVSAMSKLGKKYGKIAESLFAVGGIFIGVYLANILMNKLSNAIFKEDNGRKVKLTDFSAHLDDVIVAASYVSDAPAVQKVARVVPLALMVPGLEVGNKKSN